MDRKSSKVGQMLGQMVEQSSDPAVDLVGKRCQCRRFQTAGEAYPAIYPVEEKDSSIMSGTGHHTYSGPA